MPHIDKAGISLIEVLLYLLLSMSIITYTSRLLLITYRSALRHMKRHDSFIQISCALSYLASDIKKARCEGFNAGELGPECCIFKLGNYDCGWLLKRGRLMRYRGHYNTTTKKWSKLSVSLIVSQISSISFLYETKNGVLQGIACDITSHTDSLGLFIAMEKV